MTETIKAPEIPIADLLPKGGINELAKEFEMNRKNVSAILRGEWENNAVIEGAIQLIKINIRNQQELISQLDQSDIFHGIESAAGG